MKGSSHPSAVSLQKVRVDMRNIVLAALGTAAVITSGLLAQSAPAGPSGATIYLQKCAACHQARGQGLPGAFPKLAGDAFVTGEPKAVIATVLNGRKGMPAFKATLTDAELAAVLTHVRASWGNQAAPIVANSVATVRSGK